jgi:shikimate dehydrogenase
MILEPIGMHRHVDSYTKCYGVLGYPIRHSKSPLMLNSAFTERGINAVYTAFEVKPGRLKDAIYGLKALDFAGANVTIPHKVEVMSYLDEIDIHALHIGAVNTIVNQEGNWVGYNTDGIGYVRSLKEETQCNLVGKRILMIGAGGASRGVSYALAQEGIDRMVIINRTAEKAEELALSIRKFADVSSDSIEHVDRWLNQVDVIINTTSIGMSPHTEECPIPVKGISEQHLVSDLIYNPRETKFLAEAKKNGAQIHSGLGMFIYQGAYAFEYWTHQPAPVEIMRKVVEQSFSSK